MKAVFLSYNQALTDRVNAILDKQGIRGFTKWALTEGRGSVDGEPHYGTHAWPSMNASILAIVDDEKVAPADGRLPRNGRCDQDAGVPGVCLEYRKRILIPLLAAHLPHIFRGGRIVLGTILSPRFSRRPASAPHGPESRFRRFRDIRRPEAVFETYAAMRCEK